MFVVPKFDRGLNLLLFNQCPRCTLHPRCLCLCRIRLEEVFHRQPRQRKNKTVLESEAIAKCKPVSPSEPYNIIPYKTLSLPQQLAPPSCHQHHHHVSDFFRLPQPLPRLHQSLVDWRWPCHTSARAIAQATSRPIQERRLLGAARSLRVRSLCQYLTDERGRGVPHHCLEFRRRVTVFHADVSRRFKAT